MKNEKRPRAIIWFNTLAWIQIAVMALILPFAIRMLVRYWGDPDWPVTLTTMLVAASILYGAIYASALFHRRTKLHWNHCLIAIAIAFFNGFIAPLAYMTYKQWTKDETREYYYN